MDHPFHKALYGRLAPYYDPGVRLLSGLMGGEEGLREKVLEAAGVLEGRDVLELFAGTATLSVMAASRGAGTVTGLDQSPAMLGLAEQKRRAKGHTDRVRLVRGKGRVLPFRDASFDVVIASLGLHETPADELAETLREAARVLRPGARLVVFDFHRPDGVLARAVQWVVFLLFEGEVARKWVRRDLEGLLSEAGFTGFARTLHAGGLTQLATAEKAG